MIAHYGNVEQSLRAELWVDPFIFLQHRGMCSEVVGGRKLSSVCSGQQSI